MNAESLKEAIRRELPALLREDPALRGFIRDLMRGDFADRVETRDRFNELLADLRREREASERKWEESQRKWEESQRKWEESQRKWEENQRKWEENQRNRDEDQERWEEGKRRWDTLEKQWEEGQAALREFMAEQSRLWRENAAERARLWQENAAERERRWQENAAERERLWKENTAERERLWKENAAERERRWAEGNRRFDEMQQAIMAQARKHDRSIGALGARWGTQSEAAFRNALAGILEENFGVTVRRVDEFDDTGTVFGRPDQVELDVIIRNGLLLICELKSSIDKAGMYIFERKARFYEGRHGRQADRLIVISPMIDPRALPVAERLGIETYGDSLDVQSL